MEREKEFDFVLILILIGLLGIGIFIAYTQRAGLFATVSDINTAGHNTSIGEHATSIFGFTAPDTITEGAVALFSWDATKAAGDFTDCTGSTEPPGSDGGWSGGKPLKGEQSVGPIIKNTIYFLDCENKNTDDMKRDVEIVSVLPAGVSIHAYPGDAHKGEKTGIVWDSAHTETCSVSDDTGSVIGTDTSGSVLIDPPERDTTYTIECTAADNTVSDSVTVPAQ